MVRQSVLRESCALSLPRLLNLHSGTLTAYRGIMMAVRAVKGKETTCHYYIYDNVGRLHDLSREKKVSVIIGPDGFIKHSWTLCSG